MKKHYSTVFFIALLLQLLSNPTYAKDKPLLQAATYAKLTEAQALMEKFDYQQAKIKLQTLLNNKNLKTYDQAVVYQTMGYVENGLGNFAAAADMFERSLTFNALPEDVTHNLNYSAAQLFIHLEQTDKGLEYLGKWFQKEPSPKPDAHILAASAYYQKEDYKQLIAHVEKAMALSSSPPFHWYELLLAAYYEIKSYNKAAELLEKIVVLSPQKRDYWLQLAGMYQELDKPKSALATYELAYAKELLEERDIVQLVKTYLYLEMPFKAGNVLEKELAIGGVKDSKKMLQLLVDSWSLAHEDQKAESVLRELVNKYDDSKDRLRLAQLYIESSQWQEVVTLLTNKTDSTDKTLQSKLNLLMGIARYHTEDITQASQAFNRAMTDKSTNEQAKWWLEHLKRESEKQS